MTKYCKYCGETKDISFFHKNKRMKDGHINKCGQCVYKYYKEHYEKNPEIKERRKKQNKKVGQNYYLKHRQELREKQRVYSRIYYLENKEKINAYNKKYSEEHPIMRRLIWQNYHAKKVATGKVSKKEIEKLIEDSGGICFWCGNKIEEGKMHLDHIYPLSRGGEHKITNLVVACASCNLRKTNRDPEIFINEVINY